MFAVLLAQAAPVAVTPPQQHAEWVMIALALIATLGNVVLALVRRTSSARLVAVEKAAVAAKLKAGENEAKLKELETCVTHATSHVADLDERFCAPPPPPPGLQRLEDRLTILEGDVKGEKAARELRREDQHRQELSLTREFAGLAANVATLSRQVEKLHDRR